MISEATLLFLFAQIILSDRPKLERVRQVLSPAPLP